MSLGEKIFLNPIIDGINRANRVVPNGDTLDYTIYIVGEIIFSDLVNLVSTNDPSIRKTKVSVRDSVKVKELFEEVYDINSTSELINE